MIKTLKRIRPKKDFDVQKIDTIYGYLDAPEWPEDLIVRSLIDLGEWCYVEQYIASQLVRRGDVIWDGGAFLGSFGIGLAQIAKRDGRGVSRLVAIDPGKELGLCITRNLERAMPGKSTLAPFAVGAETGHVTAITESDHEDNRGAVAYTPVSEGEGGEDDVESRPLWKLREQYGDYDFLKLDVEGMEIDAIKSDFDYLKERQPVIWAECNDSPQSLEVLEALNALGYDPVYLAFPAFRKDNFHNNPELPFSLAYEAVLVAAQPDRLEKLDISASPEVIIQRPVKTSWDLRQALWSTPRWAEEEWVKMSKVELIALLGHIVRDEDLSDFLTE